MKPYLEALLSRHAMNALVVLSKVGVHLTHFFLKHIFYLVNMFSRDPLPVCDKVRPYNPIDCQCSYGLW